MNDSSFNEIEIESTITYLLWKFQNRRMELPLAVELCPPGLEKLGWRREAIRILQEAAKKRERDTIYIS